MNKIELIPAIDIIDGKCVRLQKGDYATQKVYNQNPVEVAMAYEDHGIRRLHVVDLDGAASHHVVNYRVLEMIASRTGLIIDFGGGIKTDEDLVIAFDNGAQMVTLGSVAVKDPQRMQHWIDLYGQERIILGADVRDGRISTNGWKEDSPLELLPFLHDYTAKGITKVLCTDIAQDGMLQGPSIPLYRQVMAEFPELHLIASGGVSGMKDVDALEEAGIPAVVIGKAIYEGRITLEELGKRG
jgi:phosphoribosylformimino-5-aminoimidazole carboxamide ribotide isomerase